MMELEESYGNVKLYVSTSGKMSAELNRQWLYDVIKPAIEDNNLRLDNEYNPAEALQRGCDLGLDEEDEACFNTGIRNLQGKCSNEGYL